MLTSLDPSMLEPCSEQLRQELVASLVASGTLHSPTQQQAFLTIPHEVFVPSFYEQAKPYSGDTSTLMKQHPKPLSPMSIAINLWSRKPMSGSFL